MHLMSMSDFIKATETSVLFVENELFVKRAIPKLLTVTNNPIANVIIADKPHFP